MKLLNKQGEEITMADNTLHLHNPDDISRFAKILQNFIKQNELIQNIKGREYVLVDGWKFAGLNFGLSAIPEKPVNESHDQEIKYSCEVNVIRFTTGEKISYGYAICSNKETAKRNFDEYAIASMAQTRAIAKAYRNLLGFIMKAAGYEDTPAEEMEDKYVTSSCDNKALTAEILQEIQSAANKSELLKVWEDHKDLQQDVNFQLHCATQKKRINANS